MHNPSQPINPFKPRFVDACMFMCGWDYSLVCPRLKMSNHWPRSLFGAFISFWIKPFVETCPKCDEEICVWWMNRWRDTGSGLICKECSGACPEQIVANDNFEVLPFKNGDLVIPERGKKYFENYEKEQTRELQLQIEEINRLIENDAENPWLYMHRGRLTKAVDRKADKNLWLPDVDRAVELSPNDLMLRCCRATFLTMLYPYRRHQVIEDLTLVLAADNQIERAYFYLARAYEPEWEMSLKTLEQGYVYFPDNNEFRTMIMRYEQCIVETRDV